jgi:hypothetical protein
MAQREGRKMAATYTPISWSELREVLKADKWSEVDGYRERVLDFPIKDTGCVVRVYTSIAKHNDSSRGKGKDAIRVCAVNLKTQRGMVKSRRVHRTQNWRDNLKKRILETLNIAREMRGLVPVEVK